MTFIEFKLLALIHAHTLTLVLDKSFMYSVLKNIKRRISNDKSRNLLHKPERNGVANLVAGMAFDDWFKRAQDFGFECEAEYHKAFDLIDVICRAWGANSYKNKWLDTFHSKIFELTDSAMKASVDEWTNFSIEKCVPLLEEVANRFRSGDDYNIVRDAYSVAIADRILHDRQLCAYVASTVALLAPKDEKGSLKSFVRRTRLPGFAVRIIVARDRGKCAYCHIDISMELLAKPHLDHIVPLSRGGCNDLVNFQLCCASCNQKKGDRDSPLWPSTPNYLDGDYIVPHHIWDL